jgi:hypothetical protein
MKQVVFISLLALTITSACGDAAENREKMHSRANEIADSVANFIKTRMAEAEVPVNIAVPQDTAKAAATQQ